MKKYYSKLAAYYKEQGKEVIINPAVLLKSKKDGKKARWYEILDDEWREMGVGIMAFRIYEEDEKVIFQPYARY